jgi:hypothetical protein
LEFRSLRIPIKVASILVAVVSVGGCGMNMSEMTFFPNRGAIFKSQDWGSSTSRVVAPDAIPSGPVTAEDQVDAAGRCGSQATAQAEVSVGTVAGDLGTTTSAGPAEKSVVPGGISLGMTECQVVSHAGHPSQVDIGADDRGDRKTVLTYMSGPWPGMYTFQAGRLKVVDRVAAPEQPKPTKRKARGAKTANSQR